jgi:predicted nucleotidyltransferase
MIQIQVDHTKINTFCQNYCIKRLALFGSVLSKNFNAQSDIDVLVEFMPDAVPGLFTIARMERELSGIFGGRKVDLRTPEDLSKYFRNEVLKDAVEQYAQG